MMPAIGQPIPLIRSGRSDGTQEGNDEALADFKTLHPSGLKQNLVKRQFQ